MYFGSETRRQHKFAEKTISDTAELLQKNEVQRAIGSYATDTLGLLDYLYVPNVREEIYKAPDHYRELGIPYIPNVRNKISIDTLMLLPQHPEQVKTMERQLLSELGSDLSGNRMEGVAVAMHKDIIREKGEVTHFNGDRKQLGSVSGLLGRFTVTRPDISLGFVAHARPLVRQKLRSKNLLEPGGPSLTLVHELIHVLQVFKMPLVPLTDEEVLKRRVSRELESYSVETRVGVAVYGNFVMNLLYKNYMEIERKRQSINGVGPNFIANDDLIEYAIRKKIL